MMTHMKLVRFRVTNFRSVEDSGLIELDQILCLVGKNEAGKTALLHALAGLNPHPSTPIKFDIERDYPRRFLPEYKRRHGEEEAVVIWTEWQLEADERQSIIDLFGEDSLEGNTVKIVRRYDGGIEWEPPLSYQNVVAFLLEDERLSASERKAIGSPTNTDDLRKALESLPSPTAKQKRLLDRLKEFKGQNVRGAVTAILEGRLPHFMYFSHYDRMEGQVRLDTFRDRKAGRQPPAISTGERVFVDFLEYAGTSLEEILEADTYEGLNARCEGASNQITRQLLEYWTQNPHLEIEVRVTEGASGDPAPFNGGVVARARVKNNLHKVTVPFSERSAGFIWFFSFLVKFAQVESDGQPLVLLLDEPGLTLHGKAQADLLRYFDEKLAPRHQVIFSTHSPFMVPADRLPAVRVVEDRISSPRPNVWDSEGTKVRDDALAVDRDTLFPLQGALGYEITQTLFVGKHTLLVEGPGDILFLQAWSSALGRRNRTKLDPRWTICPAGGIDKIQPFVSLFAGARLEIAVLSDFAKGDRNKFERLKENKVLEASRLLTFASILNLPEADAEDVFDPALYAQVVNEAFKVPKGSEVSVSALLANAGGTSRLVKQMEACFRLIPTAPEFDHYTPAEWLFQNPGALDGDSAPVLATLERAETVLKSLNALMPA